MPRPARMLTHDGRTMTLTEWARSAGIKPSTLSMRLGKLGWTVEQALTGEGRDKHWRSAGARRLRYKGRSRTIAEWARECGTKQGTIYQRLNYGWTVAEAITGRRKGKWSPHNPGNKRPEKQLTFRGVTKGVSEWAKERGISGGRIRNRLALGWTVAEALTGARKKPEKPKEPGWADRMELTLDGRTKSVTEWAAELGVRPESICNRLGKGWTVRQALTTGRYEKPAKK